MPRIIALGLLSLRSRFCRVVCAEKMLLPRKFAQRRTQPPNSTAHTEPVPQLFAGGAVRLVSFSRETAPQTQLPKPEVVVQSGHTHAVQDVAFSPDGLLLATCSNDASVKLWDLRLGREVRTLLGASQSLHTVAFHPDGNKIAAAGPDGIVFRWNVADGKPLESLTGHSASIRTIVYSHSGETLASAGDDKTVVLWDLKSASATRILSQDQPVFTVDFSPDDKMLASFSHDHTHRQVTLWQCATGERIRWIAFDSDRGNRLRFSPDGKLLAVGIDRATLLYTVENLEKLKSIDGTLLDFRPGDSALCTLRRVGVFRFTNVESPEQFTDVEVPDAPADSEVQRVRDNWSITIPDFPRWDARRAVGV